MTLKLPPEYLQFIKERGGPGATLMDDRLDFMIAILWSLLAAAGGAPTPIPGPILAQNPPFIKAQRKLVPTAGSAEHLQDIKVPVGIEVAIRALATNAGNVYLSGEKDQAEGHTQCTILAAGDPVELQVSTLKNIWIDVDNNGDGVEWIVEQEAAY